jgi:hypothetical protein
VGSKTKLLFGLGIAAILTQAAIHSAHSEDKSAEKLACNITDSTFQNKTPYQSAFIQARDIFSINQKQNIEVQPTSPFNQLGVKALFTF